MSGAPDASAPPRKKPRTCKKKASAASEKKAPPKVEPEPERERCERTKANDAAGKMSTRSSTKEAPKAEKSNAFSTGSAPATRVAELTCQTTYDVVRARCGFCLKKKSMHINLYESSIVKLFQEDPDPKQALAWMQENGMAYEVRSALRALLKTNKFDLFTYLFETTREKTFPISAPGILNEFFNELVSNAYGLITGDGVNLVPIEKYLKFLIDSGAKAQPRNVNAVLNNGVWTDGRSETSEKLLHFLKNEGGVSPDVSHAEVALLRSNINGLKFLHDVMGVPYQAYHVSMACENLDAKTVKFLIDDAGVNHDIDELYASLRDAWLHSETLHDRRYEDPFSIERKYNELKKYLRAKKGWSPERDRERLRTILTLFENHKETFQTAIYLDMCQFLKRLHQETLMND